MLHRNIFCSLFFVCMAYALHADFYPGENAFVNHTSLCLQEDPVHGAVRYDLSYWRIGQQTPHEGQEQAQVSKTYPAFFVSGLDCATRYFWQVRAYDASGNMIRESPPHTFQVLEAKAVLPHINAVKLDIKTYNKEQSAGGYIAIDYARAIFNREGKVLWVLPDIPGVVERQTQIRDLKMTEDNTITFLTPDNAVEIDLEGSVLWKAPSPCYIGGDTMTYHHEFQKTKRGTYMVLVSRLLRKKLPDSFRKEEILKADKNIELEDGKCYKWTPVSMLVEFDKQGKLIWYWDSDNYLKDEDLAYKKNPNGTPTMLSHANAFSENEEATHVYVGFRDLSRIVKINKQKGKAEYSFGEKFPSGEAQTANNLFRRQHNAKITRHGTLLIFNNNEPPDNKGRLKSTGIVEISDKNSKDDKGLVWHYDLDTLAENWSSGGGNVTELSNGSLLLCTGVVNRILEVDRKGKLVWDARVMSFAPGDSIWRAYPQYRASWVPDLKYFYFYAMPQMKQNGPEFLYSTLIANTGTSKDSYLVEWLNENRVIQKDEIKDLDAGKTNNLSLKPGSGKPRGMLVLRVTSISSGRTEVFPFRP
ncbi:MAG: aryl-sulfate sulfotransferase [Bacteroidia bacterium]|nr:aryl-sulfate sulfotransferase [Bacteroidia bacterium]